MCMFEDPHGNKYPVGRVRCSPIIETITMHHAGVWKAYCGLEGVEELVEQKIIVDVYGNLFSVLYFFIISI